MRVSAKAEYACVAMMELAALYGGSRPVRVKDVAEAHDIPQRFLVQILLQLKAAGLVVSVRGASGGYQLAVPPDEISLATIIHAIDRPAPPRTGTDAQPESPAFAVIRGVWQEVQAKEQRILHERSLADLLRQAQQHNALSYQI
ncbi:MAG: Rrf2 family transcriptional regulator [Planctomycetia bacterium]|nr:Rrf2 family transcriptional regulator [Planctomycetia bacterium]